MKILICGAYGAFANALISGLSGNKKTEIYVLTGNRKVRKEKPKGVFQEYAFEFTYRSIGTILKNIRPDKVLFLGSLDDNFAKQTAVEDYTERDFSEYVSGLTNVAAAAKASGAEEFYYLSSVGVYEEMDRAGLLDEVEIPPTSWKAQAMLHGEKICGWLQDEKFVGYAD